MLEIYFSKSGFSPGEQVGTRARRRFRLVPSQSGNINTPQPDISLWVVHYGRAEAQDCLPINMIPFLPETQNMMTQRNFLQSCGQITRKDFMLSDRGNWPQISWPQPGGRGAPAGQPKRIPAQMAYPPQNTVPQTLKRPRGQPQAQAHGHAGPVPDAQEEDQRDVFDVLTPRDIAYARYRQNHSWMEELLSSPYPISRIVPSDLGLGLRGQLRSLTEGIFDAPGANAMSEIPDKPYVGRLDPELASEFRKRTERHISSTKAEMEKLKAEHANNMEKFNTGSLLLQADKDLRHAVEGRGPEPWRLEGRTSEAEDESESKWPQTHTKKVDEIVAQVEAHLGRRIVALHQVNRIQDGGFQEPTPETMQGLPAPPSVQAGTPVAGPAASGSNDGASRRASQAGSRHSSVMVGDTDIDMGGTAAGLLDQMHAGLSNTSTPLNNLPTPQANLSAMNSNAATPTNAETQSPAAVPAATEKAPDSTTGNTQDVTMGNTATEEPNKEVPPPNNTNQSSTGEDWVMIPKGGVAAEGPGATASGEAGTPGPKLNTPAATGGAPTTEQVSAVGTPAVTEGDANDFSSLGDLDTAGDALASYEPPALDGAAGSLGEGLDLNMDMEGSAFGDAFHGVSGTNTNTPGENQSEGV